MWTDVCLELVHAGVVAIQVGVCAGEDQVRKVRCWDGHRGGEGQVDLDRGTEKMQDGTLGESHGAWNGKQAGLLVEPEKPIGGRFSGLGLKTRGSPVRR